MFTESQLLILLREKNSDAFQYLFDAYSDKIYRLAISILHDDALAEGIVQDTFLRLFEKLDQFEGRSKLGTWLYRVAYNLAIDCLRKQRPTLSIDESSDSDRLIVPKILVDWGQWPEKLLSDAEVAAELDKAIAALPETYRTIFLLREIEGVSTLETAVIANISPSAVKVRLHRARLMLRENLASSMIAPV